MRWVRLDAGNGTAYGQVDGETVRVWSSAPWDVDGEPTGDVVSLADARLRVPTVPSKIFAVGRNFAAHAAEVGSQVVSIPSVFMKPLTSLLDPGGEVRMPVSMSAQVEHEAELAAIIGTTARRVTAERALDHVFGYTCADDVTARDLQKIDPQVTRAKGFDTFCPLGPWIETDVDPAGVRIQCRVNGDLRQDQPTSDWVFGLPFLISWISDWATLHPGDVVLTGSPSGCASFVPGDQVEISITGIGVLRHGAVAR